MLERILVAARRARSRCTTVHSATLFTGNRGRPAGLARARLRPRSAGYQASDRYYAGDHPPSFFLVRSGTTCAGVVAIIGIACWRASVSAGVVVTAFSAAVPLAAWFTLPTIACPPSLTDTCCTVTFCSPPVR